MIVPDINLLIYAYNDGATHHAAARDWWEGLLRGEEHVGIAWVVSIGFIRLMSNDRALKSPMSPSDAATRVKDWFRCAHIQALNPGNRHLEYLQRNLTVQGSGRNLVTDAHIAALAMENYAVLHTNDSDFVRFPGLHWHNPISMSV